MKFSILVPVYNVEKYLEQCVDSLLSQTYKGDYEIILVDDGSTDSSDKICDRYQKDYPEKIKVFHKKNEGLVSARDTGIANASGEYSLFVDSDDFVETNLLETVYNCIQRNDNPDMVIYSFHYYCNRKIKKRTNTLSEEERTFDFYNKHELYKSLISTTQIISLWSKAVKTSLFKSDTTDYSLFYDKSMGEDWFRSIPLVTLSNKVVYINEPLYNYRTDDNGMSRNFNATSICKKNTLHVYNRLREYLPIWGLDDEEHIQKLNARWLNETMYTFTTYYKNCETKERKSILNFDWDTMLPMDSKKGVYNSYENRTYRKLYKFLKQKNYICIKIFFIKKHIYSLLKKLKRR